MTTIDHQQAAIDRVRMWLLGLGTLTLDEVNDLAPKFVTTAAPHLRAGIAEEVRNLRSQFHDDAKTAFGRIGSSTQAYLNALDDVLTLLECSGASCECQKGGRK